MPRLGPACLALLGAPRWEGLQLSALPPSFLPCHPGAEMRSRRCRRACPSPAPRPRRSSGTPSGRTCTRLGGSGGRLAALGPPVADLVEGNRSRASRRLQLKEQGLMYKKKAIEGWRRPAHRSYGAHTPLPPCPSWSQRPCHQGGARGRRRLQAGEGAGAGQRGGPLSCKGWRPVTRIQLRLLLAATPAEQSRGVAPTHAHHWLSLLPCSPVMSHRARPPVPAIPHCSGIALPVRGRHSPGCCPVCLLARSPCLFALLSRAWVWYGALPALCCALLPYSALCSSLLALEISPPPFFHASPQLAQLTLFAMTSLPCVPLSCALILPFDALLW